MALLFVVTAIACGCAHTGSASSAPQGQSSSGQPSATASPTQPSESAPPSFPPASPSHSLPVDTSIEAVSASRPSSAAAEAMKVCDVDALGIDAIAGMGLIDSATRAISYAPLTGLEPELATSKPAWMIQWKGNIPQLRSNETWVDPVCIVIDGYGGFYATGPVVLPDGSLYTPAPVTRPPEYSLPSLAP
jgi:hypothetical protein